MQRQKERDFLEQVKEVARQKNDTRLLALLNEATDNPEKSKFPDFLIEDGFIEHFQVSAANENKKGSAHNIAVNDFEKSSELTFEKEKTKFLQSPSRVDPKIDTYDLKVIEQEMESPVYSYDGFICSFKRNFEKHIKSLKDYTGNKSIAIFLIEFVGANISVYRNDQFISFYCLSMDREILTYLNQYTKYLNFILFASADSYELLDLKKIPQLISNIPQGLTFKVGRLINKKLCFFIDF